jgi:hypothetical protein
MIGFVADPTWPVSYPKMLLNYQGEGNVTACSECASLPVWLSRWFLDGSFAEATLIALGLLIVLVSVFSVKRNVLLKSPALLIPFTLLSTLLVSPYLYNYDFILLLVPFALLVKDGDIVQKIVMMICYLVPTFAIAFFGRAGNISLMAVTIVMAALLYLRINSKVDVPALAS